MQLIGTLDEPLLLRPLPSSAPQYCDQRVCLSACLFVRVLEHISATKLYHLFLCTLPAVVARSFSGGVAVC